MGRLRGGQGYRPVFRGACRCFPRSMRERERESSWTAVRAQPDECACCVVPSSILGRTDRVTAPCVLWAWAASLRPGRGRTRREVRRRSRHGQSTRGRSGAPARGTPLSYAIGPWSPGTGILVSDNFQSCRVERKEPHDLEAPSWARTGSTHHPCGGGLRRLRMFPAHETLRGESWRRVQMLLTGVTPRMRGESWTGEFRCCSRASRPRDARAYARLRPWLLQTAVLLVLMGYSRGLSRGKRCTGLLKHRK